MVVSSGQRGAMDRSTGTRTAGSCELPCGCQKSHLGPLNKQLAFLITDHLSRHKTMTLLKDDCTTAVCAHDEGEGQCHSQVWSPEDRLVSYVCLHSEQSHWPSIFIVSLLPTFRFNYLISVCDCFTCRYVCTSTPVRSHMATGASLKEQ